MGTTTDTHDPSVREDADTSPAKLGRRMKTYPTVTGEKSTYQLLGWT
jgi:hypothetical protein